MVSRWEAGVQLNYIGFSPCGTTCYDSPPQWSAGPGLTLNLNKNFAVDASLTQTFHAQAEANNYADGSSSGGRALEVLVGPRAEVRGGRVGVFLGARVGTLNWSRVLQSIDYTYNPQGESGGVNAALSITLHYSGGFYFAGEADAGVEFAVTPRTHVRVEGGDQLVRYKPVRFTSNIYPVYPQPIGWDSNAMLKLGVYTSLGGGIGKPVERYEHRAPHRFFDRTTIGLLAFSLLGQATDAVTTQHFLHHGISEADALARPFVDRGWGGQAAMAIMDHSAQIGVMFALHKIGHHRMERALPIAMGIEGGYSGYHNASTVY